MDNNGISAASSLRWENLRSGDPKVREESSNSNRHRKVAIIGSGVAGLAAAKYFLAERTEGTNERRFDVTIFERHSEVAGIWNITSPNDNFQTPMYSGLETNVPRTMMEFSDFPYLGHVSMFPTHDKVKEYLECYARDLKRHIRFNQEVIKVAKLPDYCPQNWRLDIRKWSKGHDGGYVELFDGVVVATGVFNAFSIPKNVGLDEFENINPGCVFHSVDYKYRTLKDFVGKKVFLMGSGPSYWDIARGICKDVKAPMLVSSRRPLNMLSENGKNQKNVASVVRFIPKERAVELTDGEIIGDIDIVITCTGYKYEFPFLPKLELNASGKRVCGIWEHMISVEQPTLAFVGLPKMGATMTIAEAQSAFIARAFAGRAGVPYLSDMKADIAKALEDLELNAGTDEQRGTIEDTFHNLGRVVQERGQVRKLDKDEEYINKLFAWSMEADSFGNLGKSPPEFTDYMIWTRIVSGAMRDMFNRMGPYKHHKTTPSSLGFEYPGDGQVEVYYESLQIIGLRRG